jgi:hypothetical protein
LKTQRLIRRRGLSSALTQVRRGPKAS